MTLYYYMCRSWQDCCRREENRSWPSVLVESVDSECWCLNNAIFYVFVMRLTVEERVFILESYLKTMSLCRSWQECCRNGENRSWPSVSVESVDSECWFLNNAFFLRFHNAVDSGRTCIYFGKLFENDVLRPL